MNISNFLKLDNKCTVCNEPLSIYMQATPGPIWKIKSFNDNVICFEQFKNKSNYLDNDDYFFLSLDGKLDINSHTVINEMKQVSIFFFSICNKDAFGESENDCDINPYIACYFRATPFLNIEDDKFIVEESLGNEEYFDEDVAGEIFTIKSNLDNGTEKVYILCMNYENKSTELRFLSISAEERLIEDFDYKVFKKELPLITKPNFDLIKRNELISRFDSWIILS
jgi:hypothetical protein